MDQNDHNNDTRAYYPHEIEALKREAEATERKVFREEHESTFPRTLYEWEFPAGQGYFCRIVESKPGIVHFEEAPRPPLDSTKPLDLFWMRTDKPMGCANEMIQLHTTLLKAEDELEDYARSMEKAASETCNGDEKHCSCVGLLRREVRELSAAKSLNARIAADAIANREHDEKRHRIEMENERNRFVAHLSEVDTRAEQAERERDAFQEALLAALRERDEAEEAIRFAAEEFGGAATEFSDERCSYEAVQITRGSREEFLGMPAVRRALGREEK